MSGLPVTMRLLDPPLHEFLPDSRELIERLAELDGEDSEEASKLRRQLRVVEGLKEANPMLGLRGCPLGIARPEIYRMQSRAIAEATDAGLDYVSCSSYRVPLARLAAAQAAIGGREKAEA